jgi:hypothetical protein
MKYAAFDQEGNITGFYTPEIHSNIPSNTIEITDEQWQDCLSNQGLRKIDIENLVIVEVVPEIDLTSLKESKKVLLNQECQNTICGGFYSSALGEPQVRTKN